MHCLAAMATIVIRINILTNPIQHNPPKLHLSHFNKINLKADNNRSLRMVFSVGLSPVNQKKYEEDYFNDHRNMYIVTKLCR